MKKPGPMFEDSLRKRRSKPVLGGRRRDVEPWRGSSIRRRRERATSRSYSFLQGSWRSGPRQRERERRPGRVRAQRGKAQRGRVARGKENQIDRNIFIINMFLLISRYQQQKFSDAHNQASTCCITNLLWNKSWSSALWLPRASSSGTMFSSKLAVLN